MTIPGNPQKSNTTTNKGANMTLKLQTDGKVVFKQITSFRFTPTALFFVSNGTQFREFLPNVVSFEIIEDQPDVVLTLD